MGVSFFGALVSESPSLSCLGFFFLLPPESFLSSLSFFFSCSLSSSSSSSLLSPTSSVLSSMPITIPPLIAAAPPKAPPTAPAAFFSSSFNSLSTVVSNPFSIAKEPNAEQFTRSACFFITMERCVWYLSSWFPDKPRPFLICPISASLI